MPEVSQRGGSSPDFSRGGDYMQKWGRRHQQAQEADREIRRMAFPNVGEHPGEIETLSGEDPSAIGGSVMGMLSPSHMLSHEQTLRKWEVPDLPPSHGENFGSSVDTNVASGRLPNPAGKAGDSLEREIGALSNRMAPGGHPDPLGSMVVSRRSHIQQSIQSGDPDAAWYQGKAQAMIYNAAQEHGVSVPLMRKTTAAESSRMPWDDTYADSPANRKLGRAGVTTFPNITNAGRIVEAAKGRNEEEAHEEVKSQRIAGIGREDAARVASRMHAGTLQGSDPLPMKGLAEKRKTFEVNLSDPTHPEYGYSPYVHRHQLSGHTSDVQDARSAGAHEDFLEVPRPINPDTGNPIGKPWHEEALQKPAGADMFHGTALVARTEEFQAQRAQRGEQWAHENAMNFMPGPSQSMQWSIARDTGTVSIPEHIEENYANRPKGHVASHDYDSDEMTDDDWKQM